MKIVCKRFCGEKAGWQTCEGFSLFTENPAGALAIDVPPLLFFPHLFDFAFVFWREVRTPPRRQEDGNASKDELNTAALQDYGLILLSLRCFLFRVDVL